MRQLKTLQDHREWKWEKTRGETVDIEHKQGSLRLYIAWFPEEDTYLKVQIWKLYWYKKELEFTNWRDTLPEETD